MILKVNIYSIRNPTYRLHFTHEIYILNSCITTDYQFPSYYYYVVSSFSDYYYVNILLIASKDNKKLATKEFYHVI